MIKKIKILISEQLGMNALLVRDYSRNFGLACVLGSVSGFFLKSHTSHQLVSLAILFFIGVISSYFGVKKVINDD